MNKTLKLCITILIIILSLYGIIILFQKIRYDPSKDNRVVKGKGLKYWIEPYYYTDDNSSKKCGTSECVICSEDFTPENPAIHPCSFSETHCFHKGCIDGWIQAGGTSCPICRRPLLNLPQIQAVNYIDRERQRDQEEQEYAESMDDFQELVNNEGRRNEFLNLLLSMYPMTEEDKQNVIDNPLLNVEEQNKVRNNLKITDIAYALSNQNRAEQKAAILRYSPHLIVQESLIQDPFFNRDQKRKIEEIMRIIEFQRQMGLL
jgi:hypothetical protein